MLVTAKEIFERAKLEERFLGVLVSENIDFLRSATALVESEAAVQNINVNLAEALRDVSAGDRGKLAEGWLLDISGGVCGQPLLLSGIDLLFEPTLRLDPLKLMQLLSQHCSLIVEWPGNFENNTLVYAVPEHRHYRQWPNPDAVIAILNERVYGAFP